MNPWEGAGQAGGVDTRLGEQLARFLDLAASQAKLAAANMANIDTPGYRTLGMDFESAMKNALSEVEEGRPAGPVPLGNVDGLIARPDGNDVSMDRESLQLAEAQLRFKAGISLLHLEYQKINDAIHADAK